jgi:hypothetical protein
MRSATRAAAPATRRAGPAGRRGDARKPVRQRGDRPLAIAARPRALERDPGGRCAAHARGCVGVGRRAGRHRARAPGRAARRRGRHLRGRAPDRARRPARAARQRHLAGRSRAHRRRRHPPHRLGGGLQASAPQARKAAAARPITSSWRRSRARPRSSPASSHR